METLQLGFQLAVLHNLVSDEASIGMLPVGEKNSGFLLEGEGVVVLAGLAVSDQVASLFAQPEQRLCICPADRAMVPAADAGGKEGRGREQNAQACV